MKVDVVKNQNYTAVRQRANYQNGGYNASRSANSQSFTGVASETETPSK